MNMRPEFADIVSGWCLYSGIEDLTDRIERAAEWTKHNGPLQPDEEATIKLQYDPYADLINANRDEMLRKHEEAVQRVRKCLEPVKNSVGSAFDALKVLDALSLFHPMHGESWKGWPE